MDSKQELLTRIAERKVTIGIVGLGYVGLPLAVAFAEEGFTVVGVDVDASRVAALNRGESHVEDVPSARLAPYVLDGRFRASTDYADLADAGAISICVPTPLRKTKDPDISYIVQAADCLAATLVLGLVSRGVFHHAIDVLLAETARCRDGDLRADHSGRRRRCGQCPPSMPGSPRG